MEGELREERRKGRDKRKRKSTASFSHSYNTKLVNREEPGNDTTNSLAVGISMGSA